MKSPGLNFSAESGDQRFDAAVDDFAVLLGENRCTTVRKLL